MSMLMQTFTPRLPPGPAHRPQAILPTPVVRGSGTQAVGSARTSTTGLRREAARMLLRPLARDPDAAERAAQPPRPPFRRESQAEVLHATLACAAGARVGRAPRPRR